jgi:tetratricopeptide (TPR) repeat protein
LRSEQARAAASLGRGDDAIARAREALELLGEDDPAERGNAMWALAEGLALTGELEGAFEAFGSAVDLLGHQGRWREASQAARAWARLLREQGREADALDVLERATDLAVRFEVTPQPK